MRLIINFFSKLGVDLIARLIGFITLPLITRALGPEGYGQFTYLFVVLSYFGFFIDFGYLNYGTNKLCDKADPASVISKIISLQILTLSVSFTSLLIVSYFFLDFYKYIMILVFSVTYISQILSIRYYYLAGNKLYYNSFSELCGQIVYAALIFLVFVNYPDVFVLIIFSVIQSLVTALFLFFPFIKNHKIKINLNLKSNFETLKEAYKLGLSSKAEGITASFIILSLGFFLDVESVGLYNAPYKIYLIMLTIVQGLSYTLMPVLLKNVKSSDSESFKYISLIFYTYLSIGTVLFLFTIFFSQDIIEIIFGEKFVESVPILKSFSLTILLWPAVMFCGLVILAFNKFNYILITTISSALFSMIFSPVLIYFFKVNGAGYVLPLVAICSIAVNIYFLRIIGKSQNFSLLKIFSLKNAVADIKKLTGKQAYNHS